MNLGQRLRPVAALRLFICPAVAALIGHGIASACSSGEGRTTEATHRQMLAQASPAAAVSGGDDRVAAAQIYGERCAACHGADGSGKGPASASLQPPPVNFQDRKWQHSVSDATIAKAIVEGGASLGLSNQMMGNPDLEDQPGVVKALVASVRGYGK